MERKIAIIGGGISGLLACKYTLSKGFNPIVFEAKNCIGGVWTKSVETTKIQTPKPFYQFSDFPWPDSVQDEFPDQQQVLDYINSYAQHFDLIKHIKFNSKVVGIQYVGASDKEMQSWSLWDTNNAKWRVEVQSTQSPSSSTQVYEVDFVILCPGRFSDVPNIPEFGEGKGPKAFEGEVIHSMDYVNMDFQSAKEFVRGKRVTVVGFQKFALDIATECAIANGAENPCTVLYKTEHWMMPDYSPWGVPFAYLYFNRFAELLVHKPGEGFLLYLLATLLSPLRWAISKFMESYIKKKLPLKKFGVLPTHSFLQELSSCLIASVPPMFFQKAEEGSIILKKAPSFNFYKQGIQIEGQDQPIETDLVIMATGFRGDQKLKDLFVSKKFQDLLVGSPHAAVPLYRECIHPEIPKLAVIGFSESISNLYTSEMRCRWVAEVLDGGVKLPGKVEMEKDVEKWDRYYKRYGGSYHRRSCIGALHVWYNDQLCKDMGWNPMRKNGFFSELFQPYGPLDYYVHP